MKFGIRLLEPGLQQLAVVRAHEAPGVKWGVKPQLFEFKYAARGAFQTAASCGRLLRLQSSKGTSLCVIEVIPTVGYGSRHEIFAGRLLWYETGRDQGIAKLSSLQHCKRCKCNWVHRNVHNHMQKTMGGHLEKHICEHVIATFAIIIWNRKATKWKWRWPPIGLCTHACRFCVQSLVILRHLGHN